ncbi:MAG: protein kinase, partial [Myxococcota bacterium]
MTDDESGLRLTARGLDATETFESWLLAVARVSARPVAQALPDLEEGNVLAERFVVGRPLGRGGMGTVHAAFDRTLGAEVALKTLFTRDAERLIRLKAEFRRMQDLRHPNLVELGELFEAKGRWFFTMELVEGVSFLRWVRPEGALDEDRLRQALAQLSVGLSALHQHGLVHRDVKPSNTLVTDAGRVVLLDFGLVAEAHDRSEREIVGTAAYMAPEQAEGAEANAAVDTYATGVMLYEALTGELPFAGDMETILRQRREQSAPRPRGSSLPADLVDLCELLLARSPRKRPPVDAIESVAGRRPRATSVFPAPLFVGRRRVLQDLRDAMDDAPTLVELRGDSGIGKSALLARFENTLRQQALVFTGRCYEREHVPHKGLDEVVDALFRYLSGQPNLPDALRPGPSLARMFPVLAPLAAKGQPVTNPQNARRQAIAELRRLLGALGEEGPLAILIDDFQWADTDSAAILQALRGGVDAPRVSILVARRLEDGPTLTADASFSLAPLEPAEARELARATGANADRVTRIAEESGGHPYFLSELARGSIANLHSALQERAAGLSTTEQRVLEAAVLSTRPLPAAVLASAVERDLKTLVQAVRNLQGARLLRGTGASHVEPYHDRVRQALTDEIGAPQEVHRRLAGALEAWPDAGPEAIATHWDGAGQRDRAFPHALRAAERARASLAFDRAASLYRWCLELRSPTFEVLRDLGATLADAGRGIEAAKAYTEAAERAPVVETAELERHAALQTLRAGHIDDGLEAMDRVLVHLGMARPTTLPQTLRQLVTERARAALTPIASTNTLTSARQRKLDTCWAVGMALSMLEPVAGSLYQARYLRLAKRAGDPGRIALGLAMQAIPAASGGPPGTRAHRLLQRARELASDQTDPRLDAHLTMAEATVAFLTGDWRGTRATSERAVRLFQERKAGVAWELATAQRLSLTAIWHTGDIHTLRKRVRDVVRDAIERGDRYALTQFQTTVVPVVHLADGEVAQAKRDLEEAV